MTFVQYCIDPTTGKTAVKSQASVEDFTYPIDCSRVLAANQTPVVVSIALVLTNGQTPITLADAPTTVGDVVYQRVESAVLIAGNDYQLRLVFQPSGTTNKYLAVLPINCPNL